MKEQQPLYSWLEKYLAYLKYEKNLANNSIDNYQRQLTAAFNKLDIETWYNSRYV